jgi:nucleoside-diphosphate-sugar epimerase
MSSTAERHVDLRPGAPSVVGPVPAARDSGRKRRNVLVIGGAGYVGSVLVRRLLDRGYRVTVLDSLVYGDEGLRALYHRPGFDVVQGDLRSVEAIVRACKGAGAIVHLGGLAGDPVCAVDEQLTLEVNLESTRTVAAVARGMGVRRFVFASSCAVYGASAELLDERSPAAPVSLYAQTKIESERLLLQLASPTFVPTALRFGTFFGMSPRPRFDLVVNLLVAKAVTDGFVTIFGGSQWRPFIHVEDGAEVVLRCLQAPGRLVRGEVFNAGSDEQNYSISQVADLIAELVPGTTIDRQPPLAVEANYRVSFAKVRKRLGFTARRSLADGILEIGAAIEAGRVPDYLDHRFNNQKTLAAAVRSELIGTADPVWAAAGSLN